MESYPRPPSVIDRNARTPMKRYRFCCSRILVRVGSSVIRKLLRIQRRASWRISFYFWRNVGRGKKQGEERGRWGSGENDVSGFQPRSMRFLDSLCGTETNAPLLMGQSTLSIHHIDGKKHYPYGYYANHDAKEDQFALPITDSKSTLPIFAQLFRSCGNRKQVFLLLFHTTAMRINAKDVLTSVVKHYFYPILFRRIEL